MFSIYKERLDELNRNLNEFLDEHCKTEQCRRMVFNFGENLEIPMSLFLNHELNPKRNGHDALCRLQKKMQEYKTAAFYIMGDDKSQRKFQLSSTVASPSKNVIERFMETEWVWIAGVDQDELRFKFLVRVSGKEYAKVLKKKIGKKKKVSSINLVYSDLQGCKTLEVYAVDEEEIRKELTLKYTSSFAKIHFRN